MKHLRTIGTAVFAALATVAGSAAAQTPSAGPPPPPPAAMPAKPAAAPAPAPAAAKPAPVPAAAKPATAAAPAPAAAKPAVAAAPPPPPAPKPAAELEQLKLFEATWKCEGKQPAGPMGPEQDYKSTFKGKKDVESFWISFEYSQKKSKAHAMPVIAKGYLGYDPAAKKYVSLGVDNMGGSVTESSPGWEADKLTFTGDGQMGGQKISFRETYTKKGDKEMIWSGEMKMGKDWIPVGTDTCKK
ncbi:MAG TPA: DUF1579 family protein [Polyangia bacterium]|nr:DUF1579 family protein [Polyangia bacterium]